MRNFLNQISFTAEDDEAALLIEAARSRRCSKSYILRELIRQNLATQNAHSIKSPLAQAQGGRTVVH